MSPSIPLTNQPDGRPDFAAGAPGVDLPGALDAGAVFMVDAYSNAVMARVESAEVKTAAAFGSFDQTVPAAGDMGAGPGPDMVLGTPSGGGGAIAYSGDPFGPSPFGVLVDPTPAADGAFAAFTAGLGDVAGDAPAEIALGDTGGTHAGAVHIASACASQVLRTIADPGNETGGRFGAAIAALGDRNADGFLDLAVGAPASDGGAGRVYTFTSSGPAASAFAGCSFSSTPGPRSTPRPRRGATVQARVLRRLDMKPSKRRIKSGSSLRLRGRLRTSAGQASCQRRQKIALQRRKLRSRRYQTFEVAVTARNGRFSLRTRPGRSYRFRARVSQTARCMGATSRATKVVVRKRSTRR